MQLSIVYKGKTQPVEVDDDADLSALHDAAGTAFSLVDMTIKLILKGKTLPTTGSVATATVRPGNKLMMVASAREAMANEPRSDPTVRGFEAEDAQAAARMCEVVSDEVGEWGDTGWRKGEYRCCRLDPCTWQSFGTRPSSDTPHAFEARKVLLKLSSDPGILHILRQREWVVGTLGEMDPVDDRLAEKTHSQGKCLLGYNTNHGARIDVRLRTADLAGFMPYPALVETLLHELAHNMVGPHDEHFWHLFAQLKADYLRYHRDLAASGALFVRRCPCARTARPERGRSRAHAWSRLCCSRGVVPRPTPRRDAARPLAARGGRYRGADARRARRGAGRARARPAGGARLADAVGAPRRLPGGDGDQRRRPEAGRRFGRAHTQPGQDTLRCRRLSFLGLCRRRSTVTWVRCLNCPHRSPL